MICNMVSCHSELTPNSKIWPKKYRFDTIRVGFAPRNPNPWSTLECIAVIPVMIIDHLDDRTKRRARVNGRKSWFEYDVQPAGGREEDIFIPWWVCRMPSWLEEAKLSLDYEICASLNLCSYGLGLKPGTYISTRVP